FVASAGGIINLAEELTGYDRSRALAHAARIETTTAEILDDAAARGVTPQRAAEERATLRIRDEGTGRWMPGDPAAWTNGQSLTKLRP
ncbi:MAG: hypothetical protein ABW073_03690, partial [Acidimicrobiia bacterium]